MSKTSNWIIVATEGNTVDDRVITETMINDMAELYSVDEYKALVWPEHYRSSWGPFYGKNFGEVEALKAEKKNGKLRLFAKLTANDYLLMANKDGQKLFTSIEPDLDFKKEGRCYLLGIAVTDSPASTGTTRLKFSIGDRKIDRSSDLEELLPEHFLIKNKGAVSRAFSTLAEFFKTQEVDQTTQKDSRKTVEKEQYDALMKAVNSVKTDVDGLKDKFSAELKETESTEVKTTTDKEHFKSALIDAIKPLLDKIEKMETQFSHLCSEVDGQEPDTTGGGSSDYLPV